MDKYFGQEIHLTEALTFEAIAAVPQAVANGTPFFLYSAQFGAQTPAMPDRRLVQRYLDAWPPGLGIGATSSVGRGDWKVAYWHVDGRKELSKLSEDSGERHNMAENRPRTTADLSSLLGGIPRETEAVMPTRTATGELASYADESLSVRIRLPLSPNAGGRDRAKSGCAVRRGAPARWPGPDCTASRPQ